MFFSRTVKNLLIALAFASTTSFAVGMIPNSICVNEAVAQDNAKRLYFPDDKSFVKGPKDAPITLVVFSDFQCPYCSRANNTVNELISNNPGQIRVVYKHNPLAFHDKAQLAHQAAIAAGNQKKFYEYADLLYQNQQNLDRDSLIEYAKTLNLNIKKFIADMDSKKTIDLIEKDKKLAASAEISGVPRFFMNGTSISGAQPYDSFQTTLDAELEKAKPYTKKGLKGTKLYEKIVKDNPAPPEPKLDVEIGNSPVIGNPEAKVTIIEFSDFQCPFCSRANNTIDQILKDPRYAKDVKVVFKHMPLPFHNYAHKAAEAAVFAHKYGKFWEMHNELFENQKNLEVSKLLEIATKIGLDANELETALNEGTYVDVVDNDHKVAESVNLNGTPSFVINGKLLVGAQPKENFEALINEALKEQNQKKDKKVKDKKKK